MTTIAGSRALVTGGSRGIGLEVAERLAQRGAHVILWARNPARLAKAAERIRMLGGSVEVASVDVADRRAVARAAAALERTGRISILVNNAGVVSGKSLLELTDDAIVKTFETNTLAHFWTLRAFLPAMLAADSGHVVTVASAAAICGVPGLADYAASKFAAFGLDESLRLELAKRKSHVRTTVVCPYYIDTGMFRGVTTRIPFLLPILKPEDVADAIVRAIERDRARVVMPRMVAVTWLARLLPTRWFDAIARLLGIDTSMDTFIGRPALVPPLEPPRPTARENGHGIHA